MLSQTIRFLRSEDGAVTVDWVVLTAAVVGMAVTFMAPIAEQLGLTSLFIGDTIDEYQTFLNQP